MAEHDQKRPDPDRAAVSPLRDDADVAHALGAALTAIEEWGEETFGVPMLAGLYRLAIAVLRTVRFGRTDEQVQAAALAFVEALMRVEDVLKLEPWAKPSLEALRALGEELVRLRATVRDLTRERDEATRALTPVAAERDRLAEHMRVLSADLDELRERHDVLRREDRGKLGRQGAALAGIAANLRRGLEAATERGRLEEELTRLRTERHGIDVRDIGRVTELVASIERAARVLEGGGMAVAPAAPAASTPSAASAPDADRIHTEIDRRRAWIAELEEAQLDAEDERRRIRGEIGRLDELERHGTENEVREAGAQLAVLRPALERMNTHIRGLVELKRRMREGIDEIERFREACTLVAAGLPAEVFTEELPAIATPPTHSEEEIVAAVEDDQTHATLSVKTDDARCAKLAELARTHSLSERAVFLTTLFELVPGESKLKKVRQNRATRRLAELAVEVRIAQCFGWGNFNTILEEWRGNTAEQKQLETLLKWAGALQGSNTYRRTKAPLPWRVDELLTSEEIAAFTREVTKPRDDRPTS